MEQKNPLLGAIDIGTTKVVALTGQKDDKGHFKVLGMGTCATHGVKRGMVKNLDDTVTAIKTAIEHMKESLDVLPEEYVVGIAGQNVTSIKNAKSIEIDSEDGLVTKGHLKKLISMMYNTHVDSQKHIIHVLPQNYIVDQESPVENPVGMNGSKLLGNFHLILGAQSGIANIRNSVTRAGVKFKRLMLETLASSRAVLSDGEKEMGVALVDIGGGTTDIAIYYNNMLQHTAVIPMGGNVVSTDIKQAFSVLESQAEDLKIQHGSAIQEKKNEGVVITLKGLKGREARDISLNSLSYVIQARMTEIIYAVKHQIDASGYADKLKAGIVLTGGGALLKNLSRLVDVRTGMDAKIGYPNEYITGPLAEQLNEPRYSTSVGLMIRFDQLLQDQDKSQHSLGMIDAEDMDRIQDSDEDEEKTDEQTKEVPKEKSKTIMNKFLKTLDKVLKEDQDDSFNK